MEISVRRLFIISGTRPDGSTCIPGSGPGNHLKNNHPAWQSLKVNKNGENGIPGWNLPGRQAGHFCPEE
jgi:hypothetical protein